METEYEIMENGYAVLDSTEKIGRFFKDNGIIGKTVKSINIYGLNGEHFTFLAEDGEEKNISNTAFLKAVFIYWWSCLVCSFSDGSYLSVYLISDNLRMYAYYGNDLKLPGPHYELVSREYGNLFDRFAGERLYRVNILIDWHIGEDYGSPGNGKIFSGSVSRGFDFDFINFKFNYEPGGEEFIFYTDDEECFHDTVSLSCGFTECEMTYSYYTDRAISFKRNEPADIDIEDLEEVIIESSDDL